MAYASPGRRLMYLWRNRALAVLAMTLSVGMLGVGSALTVDRAWAAFERVTETGTPGLLSLGVDDSTPLYGELSPGDSMQWLVEASVEDGLEGATTFEFRATGNMVYESGLAVSVVSCTGEFSDPSTGTPTCSGTSEESVPTTPLRDIAGIDDAAGTLYDLGTVDSQHPIQLLVTLSLPQDAPEVDSAEADIALVVHAEGDDVIAGEPTPSPDELADTGADVIALGLFALGAIGLGLSLTMTRRTRRKAS